MFDEQLVTVWSAPNYCYRCGNMASILTIKENGEQEFTVFGAAEENERDQEMQNGRKMVSIGCVYFTVQPLMTYRRAPCSTSYSRVELVVAFIYII